MMSESAYVFVAFTPAEFEYSGIVSDEGDAYEMSVTVSCLESLFRIPLEG